MGLDFIRRAAPSFHRALDKRAVDLRTPKLFVRDMPVVSRTASANICKGSRLNIGDKLLLRMIGKTLIAQRENFVVAEFPEPPAEFLQRVEAGAGVEAGEVKNVRTLSEVAEIEICE
jgi:hypothetical protein